MNKETMIKEIVERELLTMPVPELLEYAKRSKANALDYYSLHELELIYKDAFGIQQQQGEN
jgi:hypothetical protein